LLRSLYYFSKAFLASHIDIFHIAAVAKSSLFPSPHTSFLSFLQPHQRDSAINMAQHHIEALIYPIPTIETQQQLEVEQLHKQG